MHKAGCMHCGGYVAGYICEECGRTANDNDLVASASALASQLHKGQIRKSSGKSYFAAHLAPVSRLVAEHGGSSEAIASALLHDAIEDQGAGTRTQILEICGPRVLQIVEECTEAGTGGDYNKKPDWKTRKDAYLAHLAIVSPEALLVSIADKMQSAEELCYDVANRGDVAYAIFKTGKDGCLWFHNALCGAFRTRLQTLSLEDTDTDWLLHRFEQDVARLV